MNVMLDYVMRYGSSLQDILVSKLTAFYNSLVLPFPSRLLIVMPNYMKVHQADRHKITYDEVAVIKFDPSNTHFWQTGRLAYFLYYLSSLTVEKQHVYIDYGKVFRYFQPPPEGCSVFVAGELNEKSDQEKIRLAIEKLETLLGFKPDDFPLYHFGCLFVEDSIKGPLQQIIKDLITHYDSYVDEETCYVLLSYALAKCKEQIKFEVTTLNEIPINIADCPMVEDFYVLV